MPARKMTGNVAQPESDERLLIEAAQKDAARFGDLYERHFETVYAFIARRVPDRDTAEDLTAEVFHKALTGLRNYEWRGAPFAAWLIRIAANAVAGQWKRSAREAPPPEDPQMPDAHQPDLVELEQRARLSRLVGQLPEVQRQVILRRFVEQQSIGEIARQLGRTEGAVKQLQFRALQTLRGWMEVANG